MLNVALLRTVQDRIRNETYAFGMGRWGTCIVGMVKDPGTKIVLDSTSCFAFRSYQIVAVGDKELEYGGFCALCNGHHEHEVESRWHAKEVATELGLSQNQATRLFFPCQWPSPREVGETERTAAIRNIDWLIADPENFELGLPPGFVQGTVVVEVPEHEYELVEA